MSFQVMRVLGLRSVSKNVLRAQSALAPTVPLPMEPAEQEFRDEFLSRIGNRDIVGFGRNGRYQYIDNTNFPYPAIRWEQNTGESKALMTKAQADWKALTMEEKKKLYRHSFCQTFAEIKAPNSEWKIVWAIVVFTLSASCWVYIFMRNNVFDAMLPSTITREHQQAQMLRMVAQRQGIVEGISSKYDYENEQWKK